MTKNRIILYNPKVNEIPVKKTVAPLGLLSISAKLKREGYKITIVDGWRDSFPNEQLNDALCVGIGCMIGYQIKDALDFAKKVRAKDKTIPIIWGGWHPSICPNQTIKNEYVDFVVRGQGEQTFYSLVKAIESSKGFDSILGLTYKNGGKVFSNPNRPMQDPNLLPSIPYDLVDMEKYISNSNVGKRTINYVSSVGCPFKCGFCAESVVHEGKWMALKADRVVKELKELVERYNIDSVRIEDNNFCASEERVREICSGIIKNNIKLRWGVGGRSDILIRYKESTWKLMKESGLEYIGVGVESYDDNILKLINKRATVADSLEMEKLSRKYGVAMYFSLMLGIPMDGKTKSLDTELDEMLDFINKMRTNKNNRFLLFLYTPFPGTPLYKKFLELGSMEEPKTLEEWMEFDLHHNPSRAYKDVAKKLQQLNFYFGFTNNEISSHVRTYPLIKKIFFIPLERVLSYVFRFRISHKFFRFPVEYNLLKLYLKLNIE